MSESPSSVPEPSTTVVHFYRAVVGHADVWRQRMDATTNWAAATTAAIITFSFGNEAPHFVLLIALAFDTVFLLMESRRYRIYHLWRVRFHELNRFVIAPVLLGDQAPPASEIQASMRALAADLGRTVPHLRMADAVGFRIYRNYGYIFGIVLFAWVLKLNVYPESAERASDLIDRAQIGGVAGEAVMGIVGAFVVGAAILALRAPSERMIDWQEAPTRWDRWFGWFRRERRERADRDRSGGRGG